jgi:DNA-binding response OmpR family regulator
MEKRAMTAAADAILVVEDDPVVASTLRLYFEHAGFRVLLAYDGRTGLAVAIGAAPAAVILDVLLPGLDGREVCRRLRAASSVPIVMLTALGAEDDVVAALESGADDHVGKPFRPAEVVARVRALLRRLPPPGRAAAAQAQRIGELEIDARRHRVCVAGREVALSPSEHRLLAALARHPGRAFSRGELIQALGPEREASERTIDSHVTHLRRKLEPPDGERYIFTVQGGGLPPAQRRRGTLTPCAAWRRGCWPRWVCWRSPPWPAWRWRPGTAPASRSGAI